jgi:hypothetical protein
MHTSVQLVLIFDAMVSSHSGSPKSLHVELIDPVADAEIVSYAAEMEILEKSIPTMISTKGYSLEGRVQVDPDLVLQLILEQAGLMHLIQVIL